MPSSPKNWILAATLVALCSPLVGCSTVGNWVANHKPSLDKPGRPGSQPKVARVGESSLVGKSRLGNRQKADVQMSMARSFERKDELPRAIDAYKAVIRNDPSRADAHHRLAISYDKQGKFADSQQHYREALKRQPKDPEIIADLGYSYYLQEKWQEAETHFRRAIGLEPGLARAHTNLGLVLARTRRDAEALAEFAQAGCTEAEARANLAHGMKLAGREQDARYQSQVATNSARPPAAATAEPEQIERVASRGEPGSSPASNQPKRIERAVARSVAAGPPRVVLPEPAMRPPQMVHQPAAPRVVAMPQPQVRPTVPSPAVQPSPLHRTAARSVMAPVRLPAVEPVVQPVVCPEVRPVVHRVVQPVAASSQPAYNPLR